LDLGKGASLQILHMLCGSRKYPYPHHRGSLGILRRRGVLKGQNFKGKYEPKLEFPERWGGSNQKTLCGGIWIFTETTHFLHLFSQFALSPLSQSLKKANLGEEESL